MKSPLILPQRRLHNANEEAKLEQLGSQQGSRQSEQSYEVVQSSSSDPQPLSPKPMQAASAAHERTMFEAELESELAKIDQKYNSTIMQIRAKGDNTLTRKLIEKAEKECAEKKALKREEIRAHDSKDIII